MKHRRHHHDVYRRASLGAAAPALCVNYTRESFALCESPSVENWRTNTLEIMRRHFVKRTTVGANKYKLWICWTHLQPNRGPSSNPVAGTCTSSGTPSSSLKMSSKETMNRRQFQAQRASSLILVNTVLQTPKRGRPSSDKGSPATVTSGSPLTPQKRPSKRSAHLPLDVRKDLVAHFPVKTGRGSCRHCIKGYTNMQCSKCDVHLCFSEDKNCFWDFHYE